MDLPDISGEGDDVRGITDELERGQPVQTAMMTVKVPCPLTLTSEPVFAAPE